DSTAPTVDLLGGMGDIPTPAADELMPSLDESMPDLAEPAPAFEEGFPLGDATLPGASGDAPEFLGAEDTNLGLAGADTPLEVHDTMFDVEGPVEPESTFATTSADVAFGDSLDVTASEEFETGMPAAGPLDALPMLDVSDRGPIVEPITSISGLSAPPAAPTASDFDMLFGNTPMGDVTVGGDSAPAEADEAGFIADSFIGREPSDSMLAGAADIATPPSPFVTETMAELYLQQGFRDEALDVYRQLLAQNPSDAGLAERVRHLEHGTRSSMALESVSQEIEAAAEAEELRLSGSIPTVPAEPVEPLEGAVPAFMVDAPASAPVPPEEEVYAEPAPMADEPAPVAYEPEPVALASVPAGPSARDIFARIASRRAVPGGGFAAPEGEVAAVEHAAPAEPAFDEVAASHAAPGFEAAVSDATPSTSIAPGGAVDRLFGMGGVIAVDEGAAVAMASAFGGAMAAPIRGEPTRKGTDELSLSSVFRSEAPAGAPSGVQRQSTKLRFDQFFAAAEDSSSAAPSTPTAPAPGRGEEDIAQFNDWLKGLKGK
ncbi:MAG: hypothetical protein P3B98_14100, partial [Gemmatimonadota bacterium]|nr:hypothetical protein [Gemmatimonadota bacterium]